MNRGANKDYHVTGVILQAGIFQDRREKAFDLNKTKSYSIGA